ncbi:MAG TPA: GlsB/YeaQ/YmgE family stress response membrane protein [Streptosporangiaceae bacterium]|nr:GlsB/YeaQ/YmgE family stress response membrane protein [Streptosporangiaceae bacterium]
MLAFIVVLLIVGLIAGALARLLVPGRDPIGLLGTIVLGVLGSFLGGIVLNLVEYHKVFTHSIHLAGLIGSVIGAVILLILYRLSGHERGHRRSGYRAGRRRRWI